MSSRSTAPLRNSKITVGRQGPLAGVGHAERQREFFDGRELVILPDSGHWPFKDAPAAVERPLLAFLRAQLDSAAAGA